MGPWLDLGSALGNMSQRRQLRPISLDVRPRRLAATSLSQTGRAASRQTTPAVTPVATLEDTPDSFAVQTPAVTLRLSVASNVSIPPNAPPCTPPCAKASGARKESRVKL